MSPVPTGSKFLRITNWRAKIAPWVALLAFLLLSGGAHAQSKKDLEDKRRKLIKEIEVTDRLLKKTTTSREATYDRYVALQKQIEQREGLIQTIETEVAGANESIERNAGVIRALEEDLQRMRVEYGRMVRSAFRRNELTNPLVFIFSAESLNQAFRRLLFLRKYDRLRKEQAEAIADTQKMLRRKLSGLESARQEKETLLRSLQNQQETLTGELEQKDKLLKTLAQDETKLKKDLQAKQKAHEALNEAIERIIREEVQRRVAESRKPKTNAAPKPAAKPNSEPGKTPEDRPETGSAGAELDPLTQNFVRQRGRLPWPVDDGFITRPFGRQKHPTIKSVEITNNGIDIRTEERAQVKAIFEGRVAGVQFIPGHDYTVILQHGDYYTVYSNLSESFVEKGAEVQAKQAIGQVSANPITGASELHFELWQEKDRINPANWIKK
jgi:septal ring factor EnvC (AmiA/AmiB activator)